MTTPPIKVNAEIVNYEQFRKRLEAMKKTFASLKVPFTLIASDWYRDNKQELLDTNSKGAWEDDLKKATKDKKKRKKLAIYPMLRGETRDLLGSISNKDHKDTELVIESNLLVMGTNVPYGIFHQSSQPRQIIPYRPFIINETVTGSQAAKWESQLKRWDKILTDWMKREAARIARGGGPARGS